jgi:glycosyltransferase involved in cell wall biosynthesis
MMIVQLLTGMRRAGAESAVALLCKGLARAGVEVHLVVLGGRFDYGDELQGLELKVHLLHLYEGPVRLYRLDIQRRIRKDLIAFLDQLRPDILHCHLPHSLIWAASAARRLGLKVFYTIHSIDPTMTSRGLRAEWRRREFANAVKVSGCRLLAVSSSAARHMEKGLGWVPHSIPVQPNPIDLGRWNPSESPQYSKVVMVGTLYPLKRVHIGIQAVKILSSTFPDLNLGIIGDGPERGHLEELARSLDLEGHISFLGVRQDVAEILPTAGVLWLLSEREGMPMAVLEAMASGVPVVATQVPGINELIQEGRNGLLVPLDDPQAVAVATGRLLQDIPLRERLKKNGLRYVDQFSLANIVRQHLDRYKSFAA